MLEKLLVMALSYLSISLMTHSLKTMFGETVGCYRAFRMWRSLR